MLAVAGMLFAGGFAWVSLEKMLDSIDRLAEPNPKLDLLQNINGNLSRLNQVYRNYNFSDTLPAVDDQGQLLSVIRQDIDSLKTLHQKDGYARTGLDSVLFLLQETEKGSQRLQAARQKRNQQSVPSRLIRELSKQIEAFKITDSAYVVKNTTSEIRVSDFTLQTIDSLSRATASEEKKGLFRKLSGIFGRKEKKTPPVRQGLVLVPDKQVDTLTKVSVDSVNVVSNEMLILSLQEFLQNLYETEIKSIRQLNQLEKSIQAQNATLLNKTEELLAEIQEEERERNLAAKLQAYGASGKFNSTLTIVVFFFVGAGLLLLFLLLRDIRRTQYYQKQLLLEKEKSDREARVKQDFLASMSHEIRTPLTSIIGYADLLEEEGEYHQAIKKSSEHLLYIANEILDLAKIESGIIDIEAKPVNLIQLLKDLPLSFQLKISEKGLKGIFELPDEADSIVYTDPHRLNQVLYNLLHNAVKFTEKGSIHFQAKLEQVPAQKVRLIVRLEDTGLGIHPADRQRIFEDYQQAGTSANKRKGSGLGLGIVKKVVTLLGGTIKLKSKLGKGTVFTVSFVFKKAIALPAALPAPYESTLFAGKSFLILDDDPLIVRLHKLILTALGAEVETMTDPLAAIEKIKQTRFDLAIIDLQMPELSGFEVLEQIRALPGPLPKLIASTANVLISDKDSGLSKRFDDLLYKPIRKTELIKLIARNLNILVSPPAVAAAPQPPPQPALKKELLYNLSDLRKFTMGDEELLKDVLNQFYTQNKEDLSLAKSYAAENQPLLLAEVVHKLASRFGQIQANHVNDQVSKVEINLQNGLGVAETQVLVDEWEKVNEILRAENQLTCSGN